MKALIVVDMQAGSFTAETPRIDSDQVIRRINALSDLFRNNRNKVIFVQHDGTLENCFIPGSPEWQILDSLVIKPEDTFIFKTANDAFYRTDLDTVLKANEIDEITITGCATDFCVEATIQSALVKDYKITIIKDAHTTADRPFMSAESVVEHYNWVWENMTPVNGKIEVMSFEDYILKV